VLGWKKSRVEEIAARYVTAQEIGLAMVERLRRATSQKEARNDGGTEAVNRAVNQEPGDPVCSTNSSGNSVAGELGLEPRMTVPKTAVLPLHHSPAGMVAEGVALARAWR
jgi:hypothetical protein